MIRNVLIDPYMFLIEAEEEIRKNISFFNKVIRLHQKNKVAIFIYQRWYEKLKEMSFQPFPISTLEIKDRNLKENILRLNSSFLHLMVDNFIVIEIDSCNGEQEFISDVKIVEDSEYYELLNVLLTSCYRGIEFEPIILKGEIEKGLCQGDEFELECNCLTNNFSKKYRIGGPDELESLKDKSYDELQRLVLKWYENNNYMESPEVKRADHHNPLQSKTIHKYKDIERKSRYVLDKLRYFGLNKIVMKDFHGDSSERPGTIIIKEVVSGANSDIINGELYFKEGLKSTVDLYFPEDIGKALYNYTDGKLEYETVSKLKDELCV